MAIAILRPRFKVLLYLSEMTFLILLLKYRTVDRFCYQLNIVQATVLIEQAKYCTH